MAANVQHADAVTLVEHLEKHILDDASYYMTYSDAATVLGRDAARDGRHIGQVTSRIDAACFYAKTPFLAMHRVRETHGGQINPRSFGGDLWRPHTSALVARAEAHTWTREDKRQDYGEARLVCFGLLTAEVVVMVYTERPQGPHVISLRKAEKHEARYYRQVAKENLG